jgi:hypothetical protein
LFGDPSLAQNLTERTLNPCRHLGTHLTRKPDLDSDHRDRGVTIRSVVIGCHVLSLERGEKVKL